MKRLKNKMVKVMTGTDIPLCSPSHPYTMAVQVKRVLDRIASSDDVEFEFCCNVPTGIEIFELYGHEILGMTILYYINGTKSSYTDVLADMERGSKYVKQIRSNANENH